jgi:SSS family solute:Na+ symporter
MMIISLLGEKPAPPGVESPTGTALEVDASLFKVSRGFLVGALAIVGVLVALYTIFW